MLQAKWHSSIDRSRMVRGLETKKPCSDNSQFGTTSRIAPIGIVTVLALIRPQTFCSR